MGSIQAQNWSSAALSHVLSNQGREVWLGPALLLVATVEVETSVVFQSGVGPPGPLHILPGRGDDVLQVHIFVRLHTQQLLHLVPLRESQEIVLV